MKSYIDEISSETDIGSKLFNFLYTLN